MHLVTSPTKVFAKTGAGHTFRKDVTTALPFREGVVKLPEGVRRCEGVMLDGEHLVVTEKGEPVSGLRLVEEEKREEEGEETRRD